MATKLDLTLHSVQTKSKPNLRGRWKNELKSVMTIDQISNGQFSGEYTSAVSAAHKPVKGSLVGAIAGDSISFIVNWAPTFQSVTAWVGKLMLDKRGTPHIYTLWQLSHGVDDPKDAWQSIVAGSDTFKKLRK